MVEFLRLATKWLSYGWKTISTSDLLTSRRVFDTFNTATFISCVWNCSQCDAHLIRFYRDVYSVHEMSCLELTIFYQMKFYSLYTWKDARILTLRRTVSASGSIYWSNWTTSKKSGLRKPPGSASLWKNWPACSSSHQTKAQFVRFNPYLPEVGTVCQI